MLKGKRTKQAVAERWQPLPRTDPIYQQIEDPTQIVYPAVNVIRWDMRMAGAPREACERTLMVTNQRLLVVAAGRPPRVSTLLYEEIMSITDRTMGMQGLIEMTFDTGEGVTAVELSMHADLAPAVAQTMRAFWNERRPA